MTLVKVSSFWFGPRLSFIDQLCLKSFADRGHPVTLYSYAPVENLPEGVKGADAAAIMLPPDVLVKSQVHPAKLADIFRYHLLANTDEIWVDTDAYCRKSFPDEPFFFASHFKDVVANGVLRLPRSSDTLKLLLAFTGHDRLDIPHGMFLGRTDLRQKTMALADSDGRVSLAEAPYEMIGPFALTHFLRETGEIRHIAPRHLLYPLVAKKIFLMRPMLVERRIPADCLSVHLFGSGLRRVMRRRKLSVPPLNSYLDRLCRKHGIVPSEAPLKI